MTFFTKPSHVRPENIITISDGASIKFMSLNEKRMAMSHPFFIPGELFYTCVITNNTTTDPSEGVIVTARES